MDPNDPAMQEDPIDAGPPLPDFGGGSPMGMGGAPMGAPPMGGMPPMGMPPMAGAGIGGGVGAYPSTNPALVAQLLGPLLSAQAQDEQQLQQEQIQSVIEVLASMKKSEAMSADAATAPAPIVEAPQETPPMGSGGY
jgi:hypothetical protein